MHKKYLKLACAMLVAYGCGGPAQAIQPAGANLRGEIGSSAATASARVERGGTVGAVDWKQRTLLVDNVTYAISASPVAVHAPDGQRSTRAVDLKPGMQVRFSTSRQNFSAVEQVVEIWVTDPRGR